MRNKNINLVIDNIFVGHENNEVEIIMHEVWYGKLCRQTW
jgi:hypothetical protein